MKNRTSSPRDTVKKIKQLQLFPEFRKANKVRSKKQNWEMLGFDQPLTMWNH